MAHAEKKKLYVGCGLTFAPQEFKDHVEELKDELCRDWHVMQFLGLVAGSAEDVYIRDIVENVGGCDAFVAIADEPSGGLGYELGTAAELHRIPTLITAHIGAVVNRVYLGSAKYNPHVAFVPYEDMVADVPGIVRAQFAHVLEA